MNKIYIERKEPAVITALAFMGAAAIIRIIYFSLVRVDTVKFMFQFLMPLLAAILFYIFVIFFGRKRFALTCIPVFLGVAFFVIKSLGFPSVVHTVLRILLYSLVAALYTLTATGIIPTKIPALLVFGLPFIYHLFVEDMKKYVFASPAVPFVEWLPEISVLYIMAALFFISLSMKKAQR